MEFEQIVKRLEWLDEQHRKKKEDIKDLEGRVNSLSTLTKQVKDINNRLTETEVVTARLKQFDEFLEKQRTDMTKTLEDLDKKHLRREQDRLKRHREEIDDLNKSVGKLTDAATGLVNKEKDINILLDVTIGDLKTKLQETTKRTVAAEKSQKTIEDGRRQDVKRLADLQGEISYIRKRTDDSHQKTGLHSDRLDIIDNRLNELFSSESDRKKAQVGFVEEQLHAQAEREKVYKDWLQKIDTFNKQVDYLDSKTQDMDETLRGAKRAQDTYLDLNQKLERRINEITELQRLGEERLRQEWVTFKAEDQKRWTGSTLSVEESIRGLQKTLDKLEDRVVAVDDISQTVQDQLQQTSDTTEQQLQELMNVFHDWMTAYERIMGHVRKVPK